MISCRKNTNLHHTVNHRNDSSQKTILDFQMYLPNLSTIFTSSRFQPKKCTSGSSHCCLAVTNPTSICEDTGLIPGITQWVKDPALLELWCRFQMWLRSCVAESVAQTGSCSSDSTPSLRTSICCKFSPKKQKKEKKKKTPNLKIYISAVYLKIKNRTYTICTRIIIFSSLLTCKPVFSKLLFKF